MRILGIMGSPRNGGNSDLLLEAALRGATGAGATVEKLSITQLQIAPCRECSRCQDKGICAIRDDMDSVGPKLLVADAVIIASPIFFYGLPGQFKALIDRGQAYWVRKYVLGQTPELTGRKGSFIAVGATSGARLFDGAVLTVRYFFKAFGIEYASELLVRGVDKMGDINQRPEMLATAEELGRELTGG